MSFIPAPGHVLIEAVHRDEPSQGGIILPDSAKQSNTGKIIAIPPLPNDDPQFPGLEHVGMVVVYVPESQKNFPGMENNQALIKTENILGVISE